MASIVITQISQTEAIFQYTETVPLAEGVVYWYVDGDYVLYTSVTAGQYTCQGCLLSFSSGTHTISAIYNYVDIFGQVIQAPTVTTFFSAGGRPPLFSWTVPKVKGGQFYVGASEWSNLMYNINYVLNYKGVYYPFTYGLPNVGDVLTADRYNELRAAIQAVPGYGAYIPFVYSGSPVTADSLNLLVSELNSIP